MESTCLGLEWRVWWWLGWCRCFQSGRVVSRTTQEVVVVVVDEEDDEEDGEEDEYARSPPT